jgi:uncharacterized protein YhbP (UPF0306 family)
MAETREEQVMGDTVLVPIPVPADVAAALGDETRRAEIGAEVARIVRGGSGQDRLLAVIREIQAKVEAAGGISDEELEAELAAHKAERRR